MIALDPSTAFLLYLGATLLVLLSLWIHRVYHAKRPRRLPQEVGLHSCEFCQHTYLGTPGSDVTQCPLCQSYNKGNGYQPVRRKKLGSGPN